MLHFENCFAGLTLNLTLSSLDTSFKFVRHSLIKEGFRVFARYEDAKSGKYGFQKKLADMINALSLDSKAAPVSFDGDNWEWHHVLETNRLEPLYSAHDIEAIHERQMPCVLINVETEHLDYNNLLHKSPAKAVFDLPAKGGGILVGQARQDYKDTLASMYHKTYARDTVLTTVFDNVLRVV
jgi:hypothetical protein